MSNFDDLNSGKDMSIEAYEKARPNIPAVQRYIILCLARRKEHGATDEELVSELRLIHGDRLPCGARAIKDTVAPARNDLASAEFPLVVKTGRKRMTSSGRNANVWKLVDPKLRFKTKRIAVSRKGGFNLFELNVETGQYDLVGTTISKKNSEQWTVTGDSQFVTSLFERKHSNGKGES